jgi:hypothetical protein
VLSFLEVRAFFFRGVRAFFIFVLFFSLEKDKNKKG